MLQDYKERNEYFVAPLSGICMEVELVNDRVFKSLLMGDGIAIEPTDGTVVSPCDGTIVSVARTKHALCIESNEGIDILLHMGIDTVKMDGAGFEVFVQAGDKVKKGQKLAYMDMDYVHEQGYSCATPMIITNMNKLSMLKHFPGKVIAGETMVLEYEMDTE